MSNKGVWATVDTQNGLTGPVLHFSPITGNSLTTASLQTMMWNDGGVLHLQGDAGIRAYDGLTICFGAAYDSGSNTVNLTGNTGSTLKLKSVSSGVIVESDSYVAHDAVSTANQYFRSTNSLYNRIIIWNGASSGNGSAISFGNSSVNDTEAEAAAGIVGNILNLAVIDSGTLTDASNQVTLHNNAGVANIQGNNGAALLHGLTKRIETTTTGIKVNGVTASAYLGTTVKTSGTSFTTGTGTHFIKVRMWGAGGGGGGADTAAVSAAAGGGGAAGGYAEKLFTVDPSTAYTIAVGTGGAGGTAGDNDGTAGGDTTFTVGGTTVTAKGGPGGAGAAAGTAVNSELGGAAPAVSTNGDVNGSGAPGGYSVRFTGLVGASGAGGSASVGGGGVSKVAAGAGTAATGLASGGAGGLVLNGSGAVAGGDGTGGLIVIDEYS